MNHTILFDQLTDDQLISVAKHHLAKFNAAWKVCMSSHYSTGRYIDSNDTMSREYEVLGKIQRYIYDNRPAQLADRFAIEVSG
jgi:hypothetical protein